MNYLVVHNVDSLLEDEKMEQMKEPASTKEITGIGHATNAFDYIINPNKKSV